MQKNKIRTSQIWKPYIRLRQIIAKHMMANKAFKIKESEQ